MGDIGDKESHGSDGFAGIIYRGVFFDDIRIKYPKSRR